MSQPLFTPKVPPSRPLDHTKSDPMLAACRDLALKMLSQSLEGFFARLEETYFDLADKTHDNKLRDDYFAARIETHNKREFISQQFKQNFLSSFNDSLKKQDHKSTKSADKESPFFKVQAKLDHLSLVANDEYEENLSADQIVKSLKNTGGDELTELEQRFAGLMPEQEDGAANPMSPETICDAFMQACKQLETGLDARLVALKAFENELSNQVADVYRHVNQYLIAQNVQRVIPSHQIKRSASARTQPNQMVDSVENPPQISHAMGEGSVAAGEYSVPNGGNMPLSAHFAALARNQAVEVAPVEHAPGWLAFLDVLQHKAPRTEGLSDESGSAIFSHNMLGILRSSGWAKNLPQMDAMTLELVAMLFEHMFDDPRLSDSVKGLIGRLQIPVLKVAMIDSSFFALKNHSARLLLDLLAESALDAHDMAPGDAFYDQLAAIVGKINTQFVDDVGVFDAALSELEAILAQEAKAAEQIAATHAQELVQNELAELAVVTAEALVQERMAHAEIPDVVRQFLQQYWPLTLAKSYGVEGESGEQFTLKLKAMDDVIWSVQAKHGAEERFALVNLLPTMLKMLEDVAREEGMSVEASKSFFAELVHCHAAAIRNGLRTQASAEFTSRAPAPTPPSAPAVSAVTLMETQAVVSDELEFDLPMPVTLSELPLRGEWVEWISDSDEVLRLRLSWISPQETRYLFTNRLGANGKAFLKGELQDALSSGRIRRLALEGSLTDRALNELRHNLE